MKTKFKMIFNKKTKIMIWLLLSILLIYFIISIIFLIRQGSITILDISLPITVTLILSILFILFFKSNYEITENEIIVRISIYRYSISKLAIDGAAVYENEKDKALIVTYQYKDEEKFLIINIKEEQYQDFLKTLNA